jgi:hypothetical protein
MFLGLLDQDPDPLVRGMDLGFGSGSGSFYQQAKIIRKTFIPTACDFFSLFIFKK